MATAASERARKQRLMAEFKAEVEADKNLPPNAYYLPPMRDKKPGEYWPRAGGRKYRHFFKARPDGSESLVSVINLAQVNIDMMAGNRPYNRYLAKGYKEVDGAELDAIVEKQQAECQARLDEAVRLEDERNKIPVAAVEVSKGRRRRVKQV